MLHSIKAKDLLETLKGFTRINQKSKFCSELQVLGSGSSRLVYDLKYGKVLKVARNKKGRVQNMFEANIEGFESVRTKVHTSCPKGTWVIAEKVTQCNIEKYDLRGYFNKLFGRKQVLLDFLRFSYFSSDDPEMAKRYATRIGDILPMMEGSSFLNQLHNFVKEYKLCVADLTRNGQWGVRKNGEFVIVDYGLDEKLFEKYYR